ncbi:hypothetical protein MMC22_008814 [Lobaria immixta]|nr:hypothetical protein [Lobaria immixta]
MVKGEVREYKVQKVRPPKHSDGAKELELNWNIDPNDRRRKMDWLREFLEEGRKVDVRLKRRQKWAKPSEEEVKVLEDSVAAVVEEVRATEYKSKKEHKARLGEPGSVHFFLQGPAKKKEKIKGTDGKESRRMEREKEMEEKKERRKKRAEERHELLQNTLKAKV